MKKVSLVIPAGTADDVDIDNVVDSLDAVLDTLENGGRITHETMRDTLENIVLFFRYDKMTASCVLDAMRNSDILAVSQLGNDVLEILSNNGLVWIETPDTLH